MAQSRKILGQAAPPADTDTLLYAAKAQTTISTVFVCSTAASITFRLWVRRSGESTSLKQYLYYDETLAAKETIAVTAGITLDVGDDVMIRSSAATVAFSAFGSVSE